VTGPAEISNNNITTNVVVANNQQQSNQVGISLSSMSGSVMVDGNTVTLVPTEQSRGFSLDCTGGAYDVTIQNNVVLTNLPMVCTWGGGGGGGGRG
jgi:hypothetical protein